MADISPNWNAGGWADNGPGTGGWDPKAATSKTGTPATSGKPAPKFGEATFFNNVKYDVSNYQYPSDLMGSSEKYGSNYVVFYINVAVDSKVLKDPNTEVVNDIIPRDAGDLVGQAQKNPNAAKIVGSIGGGIGAGLAGKTLASGLGANKNLSNTIGAVAGVGAGATIASSASTFTGQKKRLKTAIALHVPNQLTTRYGINYEEEGTDLFNLALAGAAGTSSLAKSLMKGALPDNFGGNIAAAVEAKTLQVPGMAGLSKLTGNAPNPRKEQIFRSVDFRTFQFAYEFFPRDAQEAEYVMNIINQFKYHMHPEFKDANNFLYIYPSEFDIFYYHGSMENMYINKHTSCVLTEMTVNYAPQGQFTTFENGMPTQINVIMTFKELALLTKDKIKKGL